MPGRRVLVSSELRTLLGAQELSGLDVSWVEPNEPVPTGRFEAFVPLLVRRVTAADIDRLEGLRVIANCAVGFENIDVAHAARRKVPVTNTPGVLTESTADLTLALILAVARGLHPAEDLLRRGDWKGWHPAEFLGLELRDAVLGIIGAGRIGQAVGRRAASFGMRILYDSTHAQPDFERATGATRVSRERLLADSDVVTVHVPSNETTRGSMDRSVFTRMKKGAIFINTARGDIVDDDALADALSSGHLGGAGLDVFRGEPRINPRLFSAPRLTMLPHIGSATTKTRRAMAALALANVQAVLAGKPPVTPVPGSVTG